MVQNLFDLLHAWSMPSFIYSSRLGMMSDARGCMESRIHYQVINACLLLL